MRKYLVVLSFLLFILLGSFSLSLFDYEGYMDPGHYGDEIAININGGSYVFQDALISFQGVLKSSGTTTYYDVPPLGHNANEIVVEIDGDDKTLKEAIDSGLYICKEWVRADWSGSYNDIPDPGHTGEEVLIIVHDKELSLQNAIWKHHLCTTAPTWKIKILTSCSVSCGDGTITQDVWCERNDGVEISDSYCTGVKPLTSDVCNDGPCPIDCVGSWSDTGVCSETCDGGLKQQVYTISVDAAYGGDSCPYSDGATRWGTTLCNTQDCPVDCEGYWNLNFGTCSETCGTGYYDKQWVTTIVPANGGAACPSPSFIDNGGNTCNLGNCCDVNMGSSCSVDQCTSGTIDCDGACVFSSYLAYGTDLGTCYICDGNGGTVAPVDDSNCGTIDCSLYYVQNGTESAITIETCYSKKDITSNRCEGIEDCKDPNTADCSIQSNDVPKYTCGDCKYISSTSCTETTLGSCSNYADGTDCGSGKICQSGSCVTPVNCVGGWSDTSICSETCGDGVLQQVYSISVDEAYGGATCPYVDGDTRWGTSTCNLGSCCDVDMGNSCSIDQCTSGTVDCEGVCAFSSYLALGTDCTGICKSCSGGSCIFTDSNHDYQNECSSGGVCQNTDLLYTYTGNCDGAGACAYSSSSCSVCNYCSGSSCINVPSGSDTNNDCSSYSACTSSTVLRIYTGYCDGVGGCAYTISSAPTCKVCSGISFVNAPDGTACGTGKICDVGSCCTLSCPAADSVCSGTTYTGSDGCGGTCNVVGSKTDGECSSFYLISDHYYGQDIIVDESTKDLYVAGDKPGEGIYVVKYDSSGNLQWQKKIAGTYLGGASSIELDSSGNILIGGHLWQNSEYRRYAMIIKLSPSGSVIWSKTLKGSVDTNMYRDTYFFDIDIDSNNNIYGTGYTYSEGQGNTDLFIAKYDFLGNLKWQRVIGQLGTDRGDSIKVGNDGNIYVAGRSYIDSSYRIILLKYNSLGTLLWQKIILGSVASAHGSGLAIDSSNNIYVSDIHNKDYVLLAKYDSSGNLKWMKGLSDIGYSNIKGMDLANNNIFISIYTSSVGLGAAEYFISKFDLNGNILSQQSFGSANLETTRNLFANDESVYVIGHETSTGTYKNLLLKIPSNMDFTGEYGVYSLINQNLILSNLALTSSSSTLIGATSHLIPESSNQVSYTITKSYSKINLD